MTPKRVEIPATAERPCAIRLNLYYQRYIHIDITAPIGHPTFATATCPLADCDVTRHNDFAVIHVGEMSVFVSLDDVGRIAELGVELREAKKDRKDG